MPVAVAPRRGRPPKFLSVVGEAGEDVIASTDVLLDEPLSKRQVQAVLEIRAVARRVAGEIGYAHVDHNLPPRDA